MRKFLLIITALTILFLAVACTQESAVPAEVPPQIEEILEEVVEVPLLEEDEMQIEEISTNLPNVFAQPYISVFGRQAAEDFLAQFLSIFSFSDDADAGALITIDWYQHVFLNRAGDIIEIGDIPFLWTDGRATRFQLYSFDDSGIPYIIIWSHPFNHGGFGATLHQFIDGEFVPIYTFGDWFNFFHDKHGRIIVSFSDDYTGVHGDYYMDIEDGDVTFEPLPIGADIAIAPILPLSDLEDEITASIMERLGLIQPESSLGRQAAENFVYDLTRAFDVGWDFDARVRFGLDDYFLMEIFGWHDAQGRFPHTFGFIPEGFAFGDRATPFAIVIDSFEIVMYDLDGSGILDILVHYSHEYWPSVNMLYRFMDGAYVPILSSRFPLNFFHDEQGRIVLFFNYSLGPGAASAHGYYYMDFADDGPAVEVIINSGIDFAAWLEHHEATQFLDEFYVFGTDIAITRIPRLYDAEAEIITSVNERLGVTQ
ncbi:MAG: hypothetical protein FWC76_01435 [Defluviitaleaceae bacterium]|nr:hypothetical protein [Defluviitaleaceae bacterium]